MAERPRLIERPAQAIRDYFRTHWRGALVWRDRLKPSEEAFHLMLSGGVGIVGGLTFFVFNAFHACLQWLFVGRTGNLLVIVQNLAPWQRILIPTLGGLVAGLILVLGLRLIGNPGMSNLLEVVVAGDGRLPLRTAIMNALSSLVSISSGASIGREGLVIQLSSTFSSKIGVIARWPPYRLRLLVACGAASGIASAYNAPIAGAVFAAQIILGNFSMNLFAPLVFSSVVATVVTRGFAGITERMFGDAAQQYIVTTTIEFDRLGQLPSFVVLGILAGILGAIFIKALRASEMLYSRTKLPLYVRTCLGALVVGIIACYYPEVWGNGNVATNKILNLAEPEHFPLLLLGLLLAKFTATTLCLGSGTVGGVFTPTLMLGAALGGMFGTGLHLMGWAGELPIGIFALVGMGSMLAATTHSALLAMIIVFELSFNYSLMPPLMLACAVSTIVVRSFESESIYTEPLRRKGLHLGRESSHIGAATEKTVADLMRPPVAPVRENTPFRDIAKRFLTGPYNFIPVVDGQQRLMGVVAIHDLKEYLNVGQELDSVIAYDIMRKPPPCLTPAQKLADVLPLLLASELKNVPVVNNFKQNKLIGRVARSEALGMISEVISARSAPRL
jgi:chloride channel protein, CIC family